MVLPILIFTLLFPAFAQAQSITGFEAWQMQFRQQAQQAGVSATTLGRSFNNVQYKSRVIELDRKQPEGKMSFAEYRKKIVSADRIKRGRALFRQHRALLDKVSRHYGVQPQYLVALWGIETSYGKITGGFDVISALATLAYEGRRREFFTDELIHALKVIQGGHITRERMTGSWAGAMGQCQFMPSSFHSFAQDFNGDGRRDIWGSLPDVFASSANYLSRSGWVEDERWGRAVRIPASIPDHLINNRDVKKTLSHWSRLGVRLPGGQAIPVVAGMRASLIAPDGRGGQAFLTYSNFDTIMKWNRSTYFASSVGLLADAIAAQ